MTAPPRRRPPRPRGRGHGEGRGRQRGGARSDLDPARLVAYDTLRAVATRDAYANLVLPALLRRAGLHGRDAAFATELAYGALRGRAGYDAVVAACSRRPLEEIDPPLLDALRLGAHQLLGTRVPAHAAVASTVDLVRVAIGPGAAGFANAVLRRVAAHGFEAWMAQLAPDPQQHPVDHLAMSTSHPAWVVRALRDALRVDGRDEAELGDLLAADNARPQVSLVALPGLSTPPELQAAGAHPGVVSPLGARLSGAPDDVPAVAEGRARVQDEGSQLVALALAAAPLQGADGGQWLDLCAGPGGKAALLASALDQRRGSAAVPPDARLVAVETSPHRAELLAAALSRFGAGALTRQGDGREAGTQEPGRYDRVLVDVPCTGLGALRRRPEARWRRQPADVARLAPLQRELLGAALDAVRPGGVVGYVTCSPHPAETRLVVDDVLRHHGGAHRLDARPVLEQVSEGALEELGAGPDVQLWPHLHDTDGMFLSLLRRE